MRLASCQTRWLIVLALTISLPAMGVPILTADCLAPKAASTSAPKASLAGGAHCCCANDCHCGPACSSPQPIPSREREFPAKQTDRRDAGTLALASTAQVTYQLSEDADPKLEPLLIPESPQFQTLVAQHTC